MVSCVKCKKRDSALRDKSLIASPRLCDRHLSLISARGSQSKDFSSQILESHSGFDKTAEIDKQLTSKSNLPQNERSEVSLENFQNLQSPTAIPRILEEESQAESKNQTELESNFLDSSSPSLRDTAPAVARQSTQTTTQVDSSMDSKETSANAERYPLFSKEAMLCHALPCKARNDRKLDSTNATILNEPAKDSRINKNAQNPQSHNSTNVSRRQNLAKARKSQRPNKPSRRRQDFGDKNGALQGESRAHTRAYVTADSPQQSPFLAQKPTPTTIAVIGLGYVGLPLTLAFGAKYPTIGFDINATRVKQLQEKLDSSGECGLQDFLQAPLARFSSEPSELAQATIYLIAVPTPITKDKLPDLSYLQSACELVGSMLKVGDIVVFESTTYPTCTRNFCAPLLESTSKLQLNRDFCVGYSPERINPADKTHSLSQIVKITSGSSKESAEIIDKLYASVIPAGTHCVSSIEIAEASKALENAQRDINIAFMNEAYMLFDTLGLDMAEILQAARTKWNFLPFYPGLVGGHCISVDPYYLSYIAKLQGFSPKLLTKARIVNEAMPSFIASKFAKQLESAGVELQGARVLVVGFAFKKDCRDMRNTKVPHLCYELESLGLEVEVLDSLIDRDRAKLEYGISVLESKQLLAHSYDGVLCNVIHSCDSAIDFQSFCKSEISKGKAQGVFMSISLDNTRDFP